MNRLLGTVVTLACVGGIEALSVFTAAPAAPSPSARTAFPHAPHAGLFPVCTACHAGIDAGDTSRSYTVRQEDCARCHDGRTRAAVAWTPPPPRANNLRFDHRVHAAASIACAACHASPAGSERMAIEMPVATRCLECHGKTEHMAAETRCDVCHSPLTDAPQIPAAAIAGYPMPEDHRSSTFLHDHGKAPVAASNRCSVCHARESCERCHLDAKGVPAVAALSPDERVRALVAGKAGSWPAPANHAQGDWPVAHGAAARTDASSCAMCHVQSSCTGCHAELPPAGLDALPVLAATDPRGVRLPDRRPPNHPPGFDTRHAAAASTGSMRCDACHSEASCAGCHEAAFEPVFHPRDYRSRHAAEVYARDTDCTSCHSTEAFCRDCHVTSGVGTVDSRTSAYHDAQPMWLLDHGRAARQGLESCASCHQQTDCLQCHSARSGWRVSPHGPDFDADRMGDRSLESCAICHRTDPRKP